MIGSHLVISAVLTAAALAGCGRFVPEAADRFLHRRDRLLRSARLIIDDPPRRGVRNVGSLCDPNDRHARNNARYSAIWQLNNSRIIQTNANVGLQAFYKLKRSAGIHGDLNAAGGINQ